MKKINFKRLYAKNFLSIGDEPVEVDFKEGFNIITGVNKDEGDIRNGVGKSTIVSAFYFAIFGSTLHDIQNQAFIVNRKNGEKCVVRLEFEDVSSKHGTEYFVIERKLAPKSLKIWKNDVEKTKSTIPETNKYIKEVLSLNEDVFKNCIIMQANNTIPFMAQRKSDKKNFIESIFNLGVFSDMLKLMRDDVKEVKRNYDVENKALEILESNVEDYELKLEKLKKDIADSKEKFKADEEAIDKKISETTESIKALELKLKDNSNIGSISEIEVKRKKYKEYSDKIREIKAQLKANISLNHSKYKELCEIKDVCPTCKRPYDKDVIELTNSKKAEISSENQSLKEKLALADTKSAGIDEVLAKCEKDIAAYNRKVNEAYILEGKIENYKSAIKVYNEQKKSLATKYTFSDTREMLKEMLDKANSDLSAKKESVSSLELELGKLNICEYILGDSGVRSFIVNKLLDILNGRIKYYLNSFKSMFDFSFNEFFEEEIKDSNGIICLYGNCSSAEQKKIDIAIIFAFLDVLKYHQQIEYNIAFYDEILDSSLDTKSLETVVNFIAEQSVLNSKCTYVITHKSDLQLPPVTETIYLNKINGFTTRVEQ